jgi:hypothetical protein
MQRERPSLLILGGQLSVTGMSSGPGHLGDTAKYEGVRLQL